MYLFPDVPGMWGPTRLSTITTRRAVVFEGSGLPLFEEV